MFSNHSMRSFLSFWAVLTHLMVCAQTNDPPVVSATGDLIYCPLSTTSIVSTFNVTDSDDTEIEAFFVQISVGYERGSDMLNLTGNHPNITTTWDAVQGKLTIRGPGGSPVQYVDLIPAVMDLEFTSTSPDPIALKQFSFTIGSANYLPQTGHYYEYVSSLGITWQEARVEAANRTFFGLQGYLATITSIEEARLAGEQASGAGWLGGSDAEQEGVWKWVTGPEAGTTFWNGGINGSTPNFAFWNTNEPNNVIFDTDPTGEDYVHVTSPNIGVSGSWNDLPNVGSTGDYLPRGYVVEYGGLPGDPVLQLSASTSLVTPQIEDVQSAFVCGTGAVTLEATVSEGDVLWFDAEVGGNMVFTGPTYTTPVLTQSTTYYVLASKGGCLTGERTAVEATVYPLPVIDPNIVFRNCDEDGVADGFVDFNLHEISPFVTLGDTDLSVTYHPSPVDAENNTNRINEVPYNNSSGGTLYARAANSFGCALVSEVTLEVSTTSFPANFLATLESCDEDDQDGYYSFNLEEAVPELLAQFPSGQNLDVAFYRNSDDALLEQNSIVNTTNFVNETAFSQQLFVRVENRDNGDCFGIGPHVQLQVLPLVAFDLTEPELILCEGSTITAGTTNADGIYQYQWTDSAGVVISNEAFASISHPGRYSVIATSELGCVSPPRYLEVELSGPPNLTRDAVVIDDANDVNSITVLEENGNLGAGNYEYALDDAYGPYQDSPFFENVNPGLHTLYATDKNGCGSDQLVIGVVGISKFITPNNDEVNDTLEILGVTPDAYRSASLIIMDRYGKLLAQINALDSGWNGNYRGKQLPASDYWYVLNLVDSEGIAHRRTGHFSLKR